MLAVLLIAGCANGPTPIYLDMEPSVVAAACRHATGNSQAWACSNAKTGVILCPADDRNAACRAHEARHLREGTWAGHDTEVIRAPWTVDAFMNGRHP